MDLKHINIQPADPSHHFAAIAALMNTQETEPNTVESLSEWYNKQLEDGIRFGVAVTSEDDVLGFNGIYRANFNRERYYAIVLDRLTRRSGARAGQPSVRQPAKPGG